MMLPVVLAVLLPAASLQSPLPVDCSDIYTGGSGQDGVYTIYPAGPTSRVQVYCDMSKDNTDDSAEKWTIIQRRQDGTVNFFMKWEHYKAGFGSAAGEYWLGLENMHLMTQAKNYELRVDMEDFEGQKVYAQYSSFSVGPESEGYKLNLGGFTRGAAAHSSDYWMEKLTPPLPYVGSVTAFAPSISTTNFLERKGDSLATHNGHKFTTTDKDQDTHGSNCARLTYGGFWYAACFGANPNGVYAWGPSPRAAGVQWSSFRGLEYSLKTMIMKIRPVAA